MFAVLRARICIKTSSCSCALHAVSMYCLLNRQALRPYIKKNPVRISARYSKLWANRNGKFCKELSIKHTFFKRIMLICQSYVNLRKEFSTYFSEIFVVDLKMVKAPFAISTEIFFSFGLRDEVIDLKNNTTSKDMLETSSICEFCVRG